MRNLWPLLVGVALGAVGCSGPKSPPALNLSAGTAAAAAMQAYDKNSDGQLDAAELQACPALAAALKRADTSGDGALQTGELTARIQHLLNAPVRTVTGQVRVRLDGQPLADAQVTLEPEAFMGPSIKPGKGKTDIAGFAGVTSDDAEFPGIYLGYYKVRISKPENGQERLPERYNTQTTLGQEASDDVEGVGFVQYDLTSK